MPKVHIFIIVLFLLAATSRVDSRNPSENSSQQNVYKNLVYSDNIRTVLMHVKGWEMSYPVIEYGRNDELLFSFDDLDGDVKNYQYRIIYCNADWTPSTLFTSDYMEGFDENQIDNYRFSFNTFVTYTHYSLVLPNYDVNLKLPGNYILKVIKDYNDDDVVLTQRFMISQPQVDIQARVHRPQMTLYNQTGQQITINIRHAELNITDPHSELFVTVMQNGRTDNSIKGIRPLYIRDREIVYEHEENLVFQAGNEFRNFDTKSMRYLTESIKSIDFEGGINHVELHPAESRQFSRYFSDHDINGRYLIRNEEGRDHSVDADYVMVHFNLPWDVPYDNGSVYIYGGLSDWNIYARNEMEYNPGSQAYELSLLLKQGYYNYQFVFVEDGKSVADPAPFEGNFFESENDYFIMVYHRPPGSRFDRLVGTKRINSRD